MPRVLAASSPQGSVIVRRILDGYAELMLVVTLERAIAHIEAEPEIDIILGSAHFDQGRVFELLPKAKALHPGVPFVCCRVIDAPLHGMALEAMRTSCESHGAAGFIDFVELQERYGQDEALHQFRKLLLTQLRIGLSAPRDAPPRGART